MENATYVHLIDDDQRFFAGKGDYLNGAQNCDEIAFDLQPGALHVHFNQLGQWHTRIYRGSFIIHTTPSLADRQKLRLNERTNN